MATLIEDSRRQFMRETILRLLRQMNLDGIGTDEWRRQVEQGIARRTEDAMQAFDDGDVATLLYTLENSRAPLIFVVENCNTLQMRGIFEESLVLAWGIAKSNHRWLSTRRMQELINRSDRRKLLAAGRPLPAGDVFTVYRGVAGKGPSRRVHGFSWTGTLDMACWFAVRFPLESPAVFVADVKREDIFWYDDGREDEFVCRPARPKRLILSADELQQRADSENRRRDKAYKALVLR